MFSFDEDDLGYNETPEEIRQRRINITTRKEVACAIRDNTPADGLPNQHVVANIVDRIVQGKQVYPTQLAVLCKAAEVCGIKMPVEAFRGILNVDNYEVHEGLYTLSLERYQRVRVFLEGKLDDWDHCYFKNAGGNPDNY